jgi:membrane protein DedA with SNARE-associated domain
VSAATLASITTLIENHGMWAYVLLFAIVGLESFGLPLPGETALIACGVLAAQGSP